DLPAGLAVNVDFDRVPSRIAVDPGVIAFIGGGVVEPSGWKLQHRRGLLRGCSLNQRQQSHQHGPTYSAHSSALTRASTRRISDAITVIPLFWRVLPAEVHLDAFCSNRSSHSRPFVLERAAAGRTGHRHGAWTSG